ncbi:hypothetical protein BC827DRAFT_1197694 [Russula dissimulans]|nr:hypothetical protein BC827DRAFT_1197694 [Russula dissimulans]
MNRAASARFSCSLRAISSSYLPPASVTMTKFRDPAKLEIDFLTVAKLCHTVDGLYIWEFVTHLYYEWSVIRGQRPYRRTIWIYSMNRFAALMAVIINLTIMNLTTPTNCQAWITSSFVFVCITFSFSSLLIVLRTIAIWNKNKFVVGIAMGAWMISLSFTIQGIIQVRSSWVPAQDTCSLPVVKKNKLSFVVMLSIDIVLLLLMTTGLLRFRRRGGGRFGLGHLLWKQGVIYLFVVTIAELFPMVFICLDLNGSSFSLTLQQER